MNTDQDYRNLHQVSATAKHQNVAASYCCC